MSLESKMVPDEHDVYRGADTVSISFPIQIEMRRLKHFQSEGHFVPRMIDAHGMPRDWEGLHVWIGTLVYEMKDAFGAVKSRHDILRILADSSEELFRLYRLRLEETFYGLWRAQQVQTTQAEDLKRLSEENTKLRETKTK